MSASRFWYGPWLVLTFLALFAVRTVLAQPEAAPSEEELALQAELLKVLQEETEIATRTKMNADYVPGIVSVLQGEDLERLGMRTVWEAMGLVPGVESTINNFGNPLAAVRGIGYDTLSSQIKFMVDSVGVNQSFIGANHAAMLMPIEQVERIEVIRGPGSALYGEFAFSGVVNVITRKDRNRLYAAAGSYDTARVGGHFSLEDPEGGWRASGSVSAWDTDGADTFIAADGVSRATPAIAVAPGNAAEDERHRSQLLTLEHGDFKLLFQRQHRSNGLYLGGRSLPPDPDARDNEDGYSVFEARQRWALSDDLDVEARLTHNRADRTFSEQFNPPGFTIRPPGGAPPRVFPLGMRLETFHEERRLEAGFDVSWKASSRHDLLLRLNQADIEIEETFQNATFIPRTGAPLQVFRRLESFESSAAPPGSGRDIFSATLQDQIRLSDAFTATLGLRYDDYSDVGDSFTPRVALVWQLDEPHLLKAQYGEAFRPPTLQALNLPFPTGAVQQGNPDIRPERIETYELGYIYRKPDFTGRLTVYRSEVADFIGQGNRRSENLTDLRFQGAEVEADWKFATDWRAVANFSRIDGEDLRGVVGTQGTGDTLANLALFRNFGENAVLAGRLSHAGDRKRLLLDPRPPVDDYTTFDLTLSLYNLFDRQGLGLRLGAKNLLDEDVLAHVPGFTSDYLPRPGTTVWAQLSYTF